MDFIEMQAEQTAWSEKNFGKQPAYRPMLGMIEELCELQQAWDRKDKPEIIDAIGDVGIYMLDYCGKRGWSLDEVWARAQHGVNVETYWNVIPSILKLAHHQLKGEQNIRGGTAHHDEQLRLQLAVVLHQLEFMAESVGSDFPAIINGVWAKVRLRDWTKNPNTAHEVAEKAAAPHESDDICEDH